MVIGDERLVFDHVILATSAETATGILQVYYTHTHTPINNPIGARVIRVIRVIRTIRVNWWGYTYAAAGILMILDRPFTPPCE